MLIGDLLEIPTSGLIASRAEVTNHRDRVQKTIAALFEAIAWIRANGPDTAKMIADKFKITPNEADGAYDTLLGMFTKDGRLTAKAAPGLLGYPAARTALAERPRPADVPRFFHVAWGEITEFFLCFSNSDFFKLRPHLRLQSPETVAFPIDELADLCQGRMHFLNLAPYFLRDEAIIRMPLQHRAQLDPMQRSFHNH
jgi:hypothetical protein